MQIYSACRPADIHRLHDSMSVCVDDVSSWMAANQLQLNHTKTEVLWCLSTPRQHQIPGRAVRIGRTAVQPVSTMRDRGIMLGYHEHAHLCSRQSKFHDGLPDP